MADPILAIAKEARKASNSCGVYRIDCLVDKKFYIGSSANIPRRLRAHRSALRNGRHANVKMQAAWNKYGEPAFAYSIVSLCAKSTVLAVEQKTITKLHAVELGFNLSLSTVAPMKGRKHSQSAIRKIGAASRSRVITQKTRERMKRAAQTRSADVSRQMREMWKTRGRDIIDRIAASNTGKKRDARARANIGAATKRRWASEEFRGKITEAWIKRRAAGVSIETREKLSQATLDRWKDPAYRQKMLAVHVGRKCSEETKAKMRVAALAREARKREQANQ